MSNYSNSELKLIINNLQIENDKITKENFEHKNRYDRSITEIQLLKNLILQQTVCKLLLRTFKK